jgi:UDP-N-acetylglucosamine 2-epimerase (non-hydrolysing)
MIKVLSVFGTRPEAIKMGPIVRELEKHPSQIRSRVCITAQHRQMLDQVLDLFQISPDYDLDVMRPNQTLSSLTAAIVTALDPVLREEKPDWILVQGDTTTVTVAAIVSFYHRVLVGHVEAGLRTNDKWHPFPEEINRRIASVVAELHFAPTGWSRSNLLREGIRDDQIVVTGNPVIDALFYVASMPYSPQAGVLKTVTLEKKLILVTAHRRENFGRPLRNICNALRRIAHLHNEDCHIVYPVHLNPNVRQVVYSELGDEPNITLLPPLDYQSLVYLMQHAYLVLTDSGGIQEEAPSFGKPVLVLRHVTERPEGVEAGTVAIVGTDQETIVKKVTTLIEEDTAYAEMANSINPYGDGNAASRIVAALIERGSGSRDLADRDCC